MALVLVPLGVSGFFFKVYTRGLETKTNPLHPLFYGGGQERNFRPG